METTKEKRATFTPGPWEIVNLQDKLNLYSKENRYCCDQPIATCEPRDINERAYEINHANARLIAAAPEMYEKLCELCNVIIALEEKGVNLPYHYFKDDMSMSDKLREVLAKVEGEDA